MANLTFIYGTMESGKTTKLLQDHYNYHKHNHKTIIIKPLIDLKGDDHIISRSLGALKVGIILDKYDSLLSIKNLKRIYNSKAILVDESQFLTKEQIVELWQIAHQLDIGVLCYGLKSDFKGIPFEGTSTLMGYSDVKTELTVYCECGLPAVFNARKENGKYTSSGATVAIDGFCDVTYEPLCGNCYLEKVFNQRKIKSLNAKIEEIE